jgi:hypothetical protein
MRRTASSAIGEITAGVLPYPPARRDGDHLSARSVALKSDAEAIAPIVTRLPPPSSTQITGSGLPAPLSLG